MIATGQITQVRIGTPQPVPGVRLPSAFHRQPASGAVALGPLGFAGDRVGNPKVHGGAEKAVYAYPLAGYAGWQAEFPALAFEPGAMGENLVVEGLDEASICLGDVVRCGTATLQVSQIREPCSTLAAVLGTPKVVRAMVRSGRCGWYFRVLEPGLVAAGDAHAVVDRPNPAWPISRFTPIAAGKAGTQEELAELVGLPGLSAYWQRQLADRLAAQHGLFAAPGLPAAQSPARQAQTE
ncbi:MAG: MOSC domain-containing protein [Sphingomonadales bacterium]|jgi:MOSC domain-containing protein YiiM